MPGEYLSRAYAASLATLTSVPTPLKTVMMLVPMVLTPTGAVFVTTAWRMETCAFRLAGVMERE